MWEGINLLGLASRLCGWDAEEPEAPAPDELEFYSSLFSVALPALGGKSWPVR